MSDSMLLYSVEEGAFFFLNASPDDENLIQTCDKLASVPSVEPDVRS